MLGKPRGPACPGNGRMPRRVSVVGALLLFIALLPSLAPESAWAGIGGRLQTELAVRTGDRPALTKGLTFLQLHDTEWVGDNGRLTVVGRFFYDPVLDLGAADRTNPRLQPGDEVEDRFFGAELKEAYLDLLGESLDLRLGRQIVRWGLLEGARITDRINPLDFREFLFRDVEDRYIPLWMARVDYYPAWGDVQLLLIPDMTFHRPAPAGSEWEEFELPPDLARPKAAPENTEVALRVGGALGQGRLTASYFYTWDDFPAAFRSIFGVGGQLTGATFDSRYERLHVVGLTYSRSVSGSVLSLEGAYDHGKHLATDAGAVPGNEISRGVVRAGVGVDFNLSGVDYSILYFQERILAWRAFIPANRVEQAASLVVREAFFNDRIETQLLVLFFFTGRQRIVRPKIEYKVTDHVKVALGLDMLGGERGSEPDQPALARDFRFVGYFKDHDRAWVTVSYLF